MSNGNLARWLRCAACVSAIGATLPAQANCDVAPGVTRVEGRNAVVAFKTQPGQIKVGELFVVDASLCAKNGGTLDATAFKVDATMPEHRHGMNCQRPGM